MFTDELKYIMVAAFAGVVRFAVRIESGEHLDPRLLFVYILVSSFAGWMLKLFVATSTPILKAQEDSLLLTSGIGGFLGSRVLHFLSERLVLSSSARENTRNEPSKSGRSKRCDSQN